jgi:dTDP-4-dehydrorhamnose 3,5-epimerase-like enzyme
MLIKKIDFPILGDERGSLIALENSQNIPFDVKRVYYIFGSKKDIRRGFHAHHKTNQLAICINGSCTFLMDDGKHVEHLTMDSKNIGLLIPPMVWHEMFDFSEDCILLVLADSLYDEADYIRNYQEFTKFAQ